MTQALTTYTTFDETMSLGDLLAKSGFFPDSRTAAQAVVKVLAGREIGFGPIASMTGINVIQGRVSLSANLIAAAIKRSGKYDYRVKDMTGDRCEIDFRELVSGKWEIIGNSVFTKQDAQAAGTKNMDKFARNMLFARAISNGARWYCPDIFGGPVYTPEELGATVDGETGEVIDTPRVITIEKPSAGPTWTRNDETAAALENAKQHAATTDASNSNGAKPAGARPHWNSVDDAVLWGYDQGAFKAVQHSQNAYNKLRDEAKASDNPPKSAKEMFDRWHADVLLRLERAKAATITDAELDGTDMQPAEAGEGDEPPLF